MATPERRGRGKHALPAQSTVPRRSPRRRNGGPAESAATCAFQVEGCVRVVLRFAPCGAKCGVWCGAAGARAVRRTTPEAVVDWRKEVMGRRQAEEAEEAEKEPSERKRCRCSNQA